MGYWTTERIKDLDKRIIAMDNKISELDKEMKPLLDRRYEMIENLENARQLRQMMIDHPELLKEEA